MLLAPFRHFLTLEGLQKNHLMHIMDTADGFFEPTTGTIKTTSKLDGKIVATLFFEASTRTRSTFELAAKKLGAHILNLDMGHSSAKKGETLRDTVRNLEAMQCDYFVVRHPTSGAAHFIAEQVQPHIRIINAGDGRHAHPTQAMLDMYTVRKHRSEPFQDLCFAIVGDVLHSRVARSQIQALHLLHAGEIRVIAPKTLLPAQVESLGVRVFHTLQEGLAGVDVIMMLRLQMERMQGTLLPETDAFYREYGLTEKTLRYANPDALIIHPGPINRGVEIQSEIADGPQAVILDQVTNGIAIRMAILSLLE